MNATTARKEQKTELDRLYAERDAAFKEVKRIEELLGKAENKLYAIKARIAEIHRSNGAKG